MDPETNKPLPNGIDLTPFHHRIQKPWGWEVIWAESSQYTGKLIHVRAGHRLSLQYHDEKIETQCLLSGSARLILEDEDGTLRDLAMKPGRGYTIRPFQLHRLIALDDIELVEVSTPEIGTTMRVEDDYCRGDETDAVRALDHRGWAATTSTAG